MTPRYGEKLAGSPLNEKEWKLLQDIVQKEKEQLPDGARGFRVANLEHIAEQIFKETQKRGLKKDTPICIVCGEDAKVPTGFCRICTGSFRTRGVLRVAGKVRGKSWTDTLCVCCGEHRASSKGLCRSCFYYKQKNGFKTNEEVIQFLNEREKHMYPSEDDGSILTKAR